jgi:anti-sigma-K factor RskA
MNRAEPRGESLRMHDLIAGYALDALEAEDARRFERHLKTCAACERDLRTLRKAAAALAFAAPPRTTPDLLRPRILGAVRTTPRPGANNSRIRPARLAAATATLLAAAAVAWALSLSHDLHEAQALREATEQVTAVLAQRDVRLIALQDANGSLAVAPNGQAALLVSDLPAPGDGKAYEVWVINGGEPVPAGLLASGAGRTKLALERPVLPGTRVAVSIEDAGGAAHITGPILFGATNL